MREINVNKKRFVAPENYAEISFRQYAQFAEAEGTDLETVNKRIAILLNVSEDEINSLLLTEFAAVTAALENFSKAAPERNPAPVFRFDGVEYVFGLSTVLHIVRVEAARNDLTLSVYERTLRVVAICCVKAKGEGAEFDKEIDRLYRTLQNAPAQSILSMYFFFALMRRGSSKILQGFLVAQTLTGIANLTAGIEQTKEGGTWARFTKTPLRVALVCARFSMNLWLKRLVSGNINLNNPRKNEPRKI